MRKKERSSYRNEVATNNIIRNFAKLINVQSNVLNHILKLCCMATIHIVALEARRSDSKLKQFDVEIPYFGCLHLKSVDNEIVVESFAMEDEFKEGLNKAITSGDSVFLESIDQRLIDKLKKKYNEYV